MDDEFKIIIKAMLDENIENSLNKQLKSLKLDPISLDIKINSNISAAVSQTEKTLSKIDNVISRKVNKNDLGKALTNKFNITSRFDKDEIFKAAQEYQNALKVQNPQEISKSYENLFNSIKNSFYNFKTEI